MKRIFTLTLMLYFSINYSFAQEQCAGGTLFLDPPSNAWETGMTVEVCFQLDYYNQIAVNWVHAILFNFADGWDESSLTPFSGPSSCDGSGNWDWYSSWTSTNSGFTWGPGFAYDSPVGGPFDGDPGNNYGDNCVNGQTFCVDINILDVDCEDIEDGFIDLNIDVIALGDGDSGSWTDLGSCSSDVLISDGGLLELEIDCCPNPPILVSLQDATCSCELNSDTLGTGSATIIGGGDGPYDYIWLNESGDTLFLELGSSGASTLDGLCAGNYTVEVIEDTCTASIAITIGVNNDLIALATNNGPYCSEEGFELFGSFEGGNEEGEAVFNWTGPEGFSSNDQNVIIGSENAVAGIYILVVTLDDCPSQPDSTEVIIENLAIDLEVIPLSCLQETGASIEVVNISGTTPYTFIWNTGDSTQLIDNLIEDTYSVTVTDANNCTTEATTTITTINELEVEITTVAASCNGANDAVLTVEVNLEESNLNYLWNTGDSTQTIENLAAGTYSVTVTSNLACEGIAEITISDPSALEVSSLIDHTSCHGGNDGSLELIISGGITPYSIIWDDMTSDSIRENLSGGIYIATITDNNNCTAEISATVEEESAIICNANVVSTVSTAGGSDGVVSANASGGLAPYSFSWNNQDSGEEISNLPIGTYVVTVTDSVGCTCEASVELTGVSQVTGFIWDDLNRDGLQGMNEPGIAGITVTLSGETGDMTTTTDDNGNFLFDDIAPGDYSITVSGLAAHTFTIQNAGDDSLDSDVGADGSISFSISSAEFVDIDAGMYQSASVGNYVWFDDNCNGVQSINEDGLEGLPINLIDAASNEVLASTVSDENGYYNFPVTTGQYYIEFVVDSLPDYYQLTLQDQINPAGGDSDVVDSDADFITGETSTFTVDEDQIINNIDVGVCWLCDDITDSGSIGYDQTICVGETPDTLVNIEFPSGGNSAPIQYMWMYEVVDGDLQMIPGTNMPYYFPGALDETTVFRRCTKREGCPWFINETDEVVIEVENCEVEEISIFDRPAPPTIDNSGSTNLYPNPSLSKVILDLPIKTDKILVQIYSIEGVLLQETHVETIHQKYEIDTQSYPSGIYNIKIDRFNKEIKHTEILRFIKL